MNAIRKINIFACGFLLSFIIGCAGFFNEKFEYTEEKTGLSIEDTSIDPVTDFTVYRLNAEYIIMTFSKNRTVGTYKVFSTSNKTSHYYNNSTEVSNEYYITSISAYDNSGWQIGYSKNPNSTDYDYQTEVIKPNDYKLIVNNLSYTYDFSSSKIEFKWDNIPTAVLSNIGGLYIISSDANTLYSLNSYTTTTMYYYEIQNTSVTEYSPKDTFYMSNNWGLYIRVHDKYYKIGRFDLESPYRASSLKQQYCSFVNSVFFTWDISSDYNKFEQLCICPMNPTEGKSNGVIIADTTETLKVISASNYFYTKDTVYLLWGKIGSVWYKLGTFDYSVLSTVPDLKLNYMYKIITSYSKENFSLVWDTSEVIWDNIKYKTSSIEKIFYTNKSYANNYSSNSVGQQIFSTKKKDYMNINDTESNYLWCKIGDYYYQLGKFIEKNYIPITKSKTKDDGKYLYKWDASNIPGVCEVFVTKYSGNGYPISSIKPSSSINSNISEINGSVTILYSSYYDIYYLFVNIDGLYYNLGKFE